MKSIQVMRRAPSIRHSIIIVSCILICLALIYALRRERPETNDFIVSQKELAIKREVYEAFQGVGTDTNGVNHFGDCANVCSHLAIAQNEVQELSAIVEESRLQPKIDPFLTNIIDFAISNRKHIEEDPPKHAVLDIKNDPYDEQIATEWVNFETFANEIAKELDLKEPYDLHTDSGVGNPQ